MEILLASLISKHFDSIPVIVLGIFVYLLFKKISKIDARLEQMFTKEETQQQITQETRLLEQYVKSVESVVSRMDTTIARLDDSISDLKRYLLNNK